VDEAVRIAVAIASALHYAHQHGIIHRDLKPENVLLQAGQPVIADFGIALAVSNAGGTRVTQTGLSLGTPQYMSPEQATGDHTLDGRTDIYSLGAVLYEMLIGEPPHTGQSVQAIVARVLTDRPRPVRSVRDTVPVQIEAAIDKALAKLPADRFTTPNEFAEALQGRVLLHRADATHAPRNTPARKAAWIASPLTWAAAFVLAAGVAVWGWLARPQPVPPPPVRFALALPSAARLETTSPVPLDISPDGRRIVYAGSSSAGRQLYVRTIDALEPQPLAGTNSAVSPVISPDGRWVAWTSIGRIRKTPLDGGASVDVTEVALSNNQGFDWLSNDELVVASPALGGISALWRVSAAGGRLRPFTRYDSASHEGIQRSPVAISDHGLVLYTSFRLGSPVGGRLAAARVADGSVKVLDLPIDRVLGLALGHVVYVTEDEVLMAAPFDAGAIRLTGPPVPLLQGVPANTAVLSKTSGTLVYTQGATRSAIVTVDDRGASSTLIAEPGRYAHPRLSPDGKRMAIDIISGSSSDIWTFDVSSGTPTRLTTGGQNDRPEWTADGQKVLYLSTNGGADNQYVIWSQAADGSAPAEVLYKGSYSLREVLLTRDGRALIYREDHPDSLRDIRLVSLDRKDAPTPLVATRFDELMPRISPDGRWLAYQSNESGQYEIYVRPFPQGGGRTTVSSGGGTEPLWSGDGRLFYRNGRDLIAATYSTTPSFTISSRRTLFNANYELHLFHPNYDVTPDGKRFIMIKPANEEAQVVVVVNWREELRQRLGLNPTQSR
jgi:serine/threonine-protein kinase